MQGPGQGQDGENNEDKGGRQQGEGGERPDGLDEDDHRGDPGGGGGKIGCMRRGGRGDGRRGRRPMARGTSG